MFCRDFSNVLPFFVSSLFLRPRWDSRPLSRLPCVNFFVVLLSKTKTQHRKTKDVQSGKSDMQSLKRESRLGRNDGRVRRFVLGCEYFAVKCSFVFLVLTRKKRYGGKLVICFLASL